MFVRGKMSASVNHYVAFDLKQMREQNHGQGAKTVFSRPQKIMFILK